MQVVARAFTETLRGQPLMAWYLRAFGSTVGNDVYFGTSIYPGIVPLRCADTGAVGKLFCSKRKSRSGSQRFSSAPSVSVNV